MKHFQQFPQNRNEQHWMIFKCSLGGLNFHVKRELTSYYLIFVFVIALALLNEYNNTYLCCDELGKLWYRA